MTGCDRVEAAGIDRMLPQPAPAGRIERRPRLPPAAWVTRLVITVVVQDDDVLSLGHRRDQQVGQAYRPHAATCHNAAWMSGAAPPVLIMAGPPPIISVTVGSHLIELCAAPGRPFELELAGTAGCCQSRLDQWHQDRCQDFGARRRCYLGDGTGSPGGCILALKVGRVVLGA